ncbi:hypothetical protein LEP1GSC039_3090 [Leptospira santarosai str. 2000027870]|nr:hypothetical protein LEP1GSC039_3090 [Leptospira santarosai str. 2000027870]
MEMDRRDSIRKMQRLKGVRPLDGNIHYGRKQSAFEQRRFSRETCILEIEAL